MKSCPWRLLPKTTRNLALTSKSQLMPYQDVTGYKLKIVSMGNSVPLLSEGPDAIRSGAPRDTPVIPLLRYFLHTLICSDNRGFHA